MSPASEAVVGAARAAAVGGSSRARTSLRRSDEALVRSVLAGSEADLEALFTRWWPRAYRTAYLIVHDHCTAEDIAQEAFVQAIRHLHRFDRRRRFAPWLGAIVANRAIDHARARAARREAGPVSESIPAGGQPAPFGANGVMDALSDLRPEHRAVVVLRYVLEYTPGEIARALDLPRGTVNSRLRRALDTLEARLGDEGAG